jgi:hypothetical protein
MTLSRLISILFLALTLLSACTPSPAQPITVSPPTPTAFPALVIVEMEYRESLQSPNFEITARYPRITLPEDTRYDGFNQAAETLVRAKTDSFKAEVIRLKDILSRERISSYIKGSYDIFNSGFGWISTLFHFSTYYSTAATDGQLSIPLTFDINQNKQILLEELFLQGTPYLQFFVDTCITDLKQRGLFSSAVRLTPVVDDFYAWIIQKNGLMLYFDKYVVAPGATGPVQVIIPYTALKPFINPAGPLQPLIK